MDLENLGIDLENYAGKRIYLFDEKPLDLDKTRKFLGKFHNYINGITTDGLPEGLFIRKNPFVGDFERVDLGDACTDAIIKTMMHSTKGYPVEHLYYFLNPAKMGRRETSYKEKLPVITKILDEFYNQFYGGHHYTLYAGNIPDPTSSFIVNNPNETELFWFKDYGGCEGSWEVLYDIKKPDTKFLLEGAYYYRENKRIFTRLREMHEQENLFKDNSVSFIKNIGWGYYLPILGVTEIIGLFSEPHDFKIRTTLSKEGISSKEVEIKQDDKNWLLPEGSYYRDR